MMMSHDEARTMRRKMADELMEAKMEKHAKAGGGPHAEMLRSVDRMKHDAAMVEGDRSAQNARKQR